MEIGKTLYVVNRNEWRFWLETNHKVEKEIWLVFYKKASGMQSLPYNDAVEEALCFGWIDSTIKPFERDSRAQRFSPRRKNSGLSEMNKERIRRLIKLGKMTESGMESIKHHLMERGGTELKKFTIPEDILQALKSDSGVWNNFKKFPHHYKNIRIGYIDGARKRPEEFQKRLNYFMKMTSQNKKFGMVQ